MLSISTNVLSDAYRRVEDVAVNTIQVIANIKGISIPETPKGIISSVELDKPKIEALSLSPIKKVLFENGRTFHRGNL